MVERPSTILMSNVGSPGNDLLATVSMVSGVQSERCSDELLIAVVVVVVIAATDLAFWRLDRLERLFLLLSFFLFLLYSVLCLFPSAFSSGDMSCGHLHPFVSTMHSSLSLLRTLSFMS